jgi:hypothetical protein
VENRRGSNLLVFLQMMTDSCAKESLSLFIQNKIIRYLYDFKGANTPLLSHTLKEIIVNLNVMTISLVLHTVTISLHAINMHEWADLSVGT